MIYLARGRDRATAETDASAARLEAQGYERVTCADHRALWRIADNAALAEMRQSEDAPRPVPPPTLAPMIRVGNWRIPPEYIK